MNRTYTQSKSHYKKHKRNSLIYALLNFFIFVFLAWVFYENLTAKEFVERLKFDYQIILFLLTGFFCYVNYSSWKEFNSIEYFSEISINETEVLQSTGLISERIKIKDIANITHIDEGKKSEHILIELSNDQFIAIDEYENMSSIYGDLKSVWRR